MVHIIYNCPLFPSSTASVSCSSSPRPHPSSRAPLQTTPTTHAMVCYTMLQVACDNAQTPPLLFGGGDFSQLCVDLVVLCHFINFLQLIGNSLLPGATGFLEVPPLWHFLWAEPTLTLLSTCLTWLRPMLLDLAPPTSYNSGTKPTMEGLLIQWCFNCMPKLSLKMTSISEYP